MPATGTVPILPVCTPLRPFRELLGCGLWLDQHPPRRLHEQNPQVTVAPLRYLAEDAGQLVANEAQSLPNSNTSFQQEVVPRVCNRSQKFISTGVNQFTSTPHV